MTISDASGSQASGSLDRQDYLGFFEERKKPVLKAERIEVTKVVEAIADTMDTKRYVASREFSASDMMKSFRILRCEGSMKNSVVENNPSVKTSKRIARLVRVLKAAGIVEVVSGTAGTKKAKYVFASRVTDLMKS